jgi:hypothetical protein
MNFKTLTLIATAAAFGAVPAAASADSLVTAAPGAQNLASGGGYLIWSAPAEGGGFQLTVRGPDGTVSAPTAVARSRTAFDPAVGSDQNAIDGRKLVAIYSRDGDVYTYDLRAGTETKVDVASSSTYEETAPGINFGRITFVRRGGSDNGVFYAGENGLSRITTARPRELVFNGSRVAYTSGKNVVIRKVSGRGAVSTVKVPGGSQAFGLALSRYALTFATKGGKVFQTNSFGGSGREENATSARAANETLPASLNSVAFSGVFVRFYADGEGIKRISTQNIFRR